VLAVVVLALAALLVPAARGVYWGTGDSAAARTTTQQQVLAAAKRCFAVINTYDYRKVDGLIAKDLPCATGTFRSDLRQALEKTIIAQAPAAKAVQTAQVNKAGIVSVSPDGRQWVILIDGQLSVSNVSTGKNPRIDIAGAVLTLDRVGDRWLVSKVASDVGNGLGG
jgi:hypothetical protein